MGELVREIQFEHGSVKVHLTRRIGYEDEELYRVNLHAYRKDIDNLWSEVREFLDKEGAGYTILIGKHNRRGGTRPYCLTWKNKQ